MHSSLECLLQPEPTVWITPSPLICREAASLLGSEVAGPVRQAVNLQEKEGKGKLSLNLNNPACTSNIQIKQETKIVLQRKMKDNKNIMPDANVWGNKQQLEGAVLNKGDRIWKD